MGNYMFSTELRYQKTSKDTYQARKDGGMKEWLLLANFIENAPASMIGACVLA